MKLIKFTLILTFLIAILAACGTNSSDDSDSKADNSEGNAEKVKIGFQVYGLQAEFATNLTNQIKKKAEEYDDVELIVMDGENDLSTAISQLQTLQNRNVDAILVAPMDAEALNDTVNGIVDGGIPVIAVNAGMTAEKLTSSVVAPNVNGGEAETEVIVEELNGKGNVVILEGPIGQSGQLERKEGIHNILDKYPDIKILEEKTANWSRAEALDLMENWIQSHGNDIDAVIAQNDEMALGAINALKSANMQIPVVGVDGIKDAVQAVKAGDLTATMLQSAIDQGNKGLEVAIEAAKGAKIDQEYLIPFEPINKSNVDDYIE